MSEWFENESFWKETYNFLFPEKLFIETNEQVENVLKLVDFNGSSVLDLCCGPGRCSIVLAKKGFSVTGVDRSPFLLDKAKERAKSEGLSVEWVLEDMRRFIRCRGNGDTHTKFRFFFFSSVTERTHAETIKNRRSESVAPHHLSWDRTAADI